LQDQIIPVFDIGGVFIDWNPLYLFRKLFDSEQEALWFHNNVCTPQWNLEFDAGDIYAEAIAGLITRHPRYWREIEAYDTRWKEMIGGLFKGTIEIHNELTAAGIATYSITNFSWEKWISMLGEWAFLEKFAGVVVSGLENVVKPDPRIFRIFTERFALDPASCVFIDDNEANIKAAHMFGMQVIHFQSPDQLRRDLIGLGLPLSNIVV